MAENLQLLPRDVAVAYRIQVGASTVGRLPLTGRPASRTFLGQNLTSEFVVARFDSDGELDNLIEIE